VLFKLIPIGGGIDVIITSINVSNNGINGSIEDIDTNNANNIADIISIIGSIDPSK